MVPEELLPLVSQDVLDPEAIVARVKAYACPSYIGHEIVEFLLPQLEQGGQRTETILALVEQCDASPFCEAKALNQVHLGLQMGLFTVLREKEEAGQGMRTEEGGNLLHHLVQASSVFTLKHMVASNGASLIQYLHPSWVDAPQTNGKTPLHLIWQRAIMDMTSDRSFWETALGLLMRGARLDAADNSGMTVRDLVDMAQRSNPRLFEPLNTKEAEDIGKFMARVHHQDLDQATPTPTAVRPRRI